MIFPCLIMISKCCCASKITGNKKNRMEDLIFTILIFAPVRVIDKLSMCFACGGYKLLPELVDTFQFFFRYNYGWFGFQFYKKVFDRFENFVDILQHDLRFARIVGQSYTIVVEI